MTFLLLKLCERIIDERLMGDLFYHPEAFGQGLILNQPAPRIRNHFANGDRTSLFKQESKCWESLIFLTLRLISYLDQGTTSFQ